MKRSSLLFSLTLLALSLSTAPASWAMAKRPPQPALSADKLAEPALPPLSLHDCYKLALQQSETLALKKISVEKSWSDFLIASSQALGDVTYNATNFFQDPLSTTSADGSGVSSSFTREERRERTITISQPLFQGFKALGALVGAGSLKKERLYALDRARQTLFLETALSFYSVLRYQKELMIQNEILNLLKERVSDLRKRTEIGKSRSSELATALSQSQSLQASLEETKGLLRSQIRILEFLTGSPMEKRELVDTDPLSGTPEPMENFIHEAPLRKDVKAADQSVKTAFQAVIIAQSKLWPTVTLDATHYEKREGFQASTDWDLLFTAKVPIFQGGGAVGELKAAYSDWKAAKIRYRQTERQAELEIQQAYESWISTQQQFRAWESAVWSSEVNYQLQKSDYQKNLVNNLDVLVALQAFNEARKQKNKTLYQLKSDYWRLEIARGNCCESA